MSRGRSTLSQVPSVGFFLACFFFSSSASISSGVFPDTCCAGTTANCLSIAKSLSERDSPGWRQRRPLLVRF